MPFSAKAKYIEDSFHEGIIAWNLEGIAGETLPHCQRFYDVSDGVEVRFF